MIALVVVLAGLVACEGSAKPVDVASGKPGSTIAETTATSLPTTTTAPPAPTSTSPPTTGVAPRPPTALPVGRSFNATAASDGGRPRPLVAKASISFGADGTTTVHGGCNTGQTKSRLQDGRLVTDSFSSTAAACSDPVAKQEGFVFGVVMASPQVELDGDVLVLRTATAEIRFLDRRVADPDRPIEGTRWVVNAVIDPQSVSTIAAPQGELLLSAGRVRYTGPCHDLEGPAVVTGASVTFGPLTTGPARPCTPDQQRVETTVAGVLTGDVKATVTATVLRLERSDGRGVSLVAAS